MKQEIQTGIVAWSPDYKSSKSTPFVSHFSTIQKPRNFEWMPQDDITAHELALCVGVLILAMHGFCGDAYDQLPENAKRHFKEQ